MHKVRAFQDIVSHSNPDTQPNCTICLTHWHHYSDSSACSGPCVVSDCEHHSVGLRGCAQGQVGASGAVLEHNRAASRGLAEAVADACDLKAVGGHRSVRIRRLSARQSVLRAGQCCRHSSAIECSDLGDRQLIQHDGLGFDVHSAV
eukprot:2987-Heterococcus_DN1.PRE.1